MLGGRQSVPQATVGLRTGDGVRRGFALMARGTLRGQREGRAGRCPGRGEMARGDGGAMRRWPGWANRRGRGGEVDMGGLHPDRCILALDRPGPEAQLCHFPADFTFAYPFLTCKVATRLTGDQVRQTQGAACDVEDAE